MASRKTAVARAAPATATPPAAAIKVVIVGHVDHGKSTLIGRLLNDTGSLPEGKVEAVAAMCRRRGMPFEWAFVTDALKAERDQGITIDVSHIWFRTQRRTYVLLDAPGHREFLRNMVTGAAASDAALLVIDAAEGVREQSRRHASLLALLGIRQVIVAVGKMDLVGHDAARFESVAAEMGAYLTGIGIAGAVTIPVSGRDGDNLVARSAAMAWYRGPTLAEALDSLTAPPAATELPLRLPVQDIYKFDARRIVAGRIESGSLAVGDTLLFSPSGKTARVATLECWGAPAPARVSAGASIGITLDEQIFIERGEIASHAGEPPFLSNVFRARLFWLGAEPLKAGQRYRLRIGTLETAVDVERIESLLDTTDLATKAAESVPRDAIADVVLRSPRLLALDEAGAHPRTGRFVLVQDHAIVGGGLVSLRGYPDQRKLLVQKSTNLTAVSHRVTAAMRQARNAHAGGVLWFTGLSGAGKSTIAIAAEQKLFALGYNVYVLDGDNVRRGLNTNLGFSPDDRAENIRRVGEVAALFADAGMLVISAFISPYRSDRERAREATRRTAAEASFHEIFIAADLVVCERRDPKGLYKLARAGKIGEFTGISAPYEPPEDPELSVDTAGLDVDAAVEAVVAYVRRVIPLRAP